MEPRPQTTRVRTFRMTRENARALADLAHALTARHGCRRSQTDAMRALIDSLRTVDVSALPWPLYESLTTVRSFRLTEAESATIADAAWRLSLHVRTSVSDADVLRAALDALFPATPETK